MNFRISGHRTAIGITSLHYKIWDSETTRKSARCEWLEAATDWCVSWSGTERLLIMALISGADIPNSHACIRATGGHFKYSSWQKFIVKRDIYFRLWLVSWLLISQGNVEMRQVCNNVTDPNDCFITRLLLSLKVKELWKLINSWQNYGLLRFHSWSARVFAAGFYPGTFWGETSPQTSQLPPKNFWPALIS